MYRSAAQLRQLNFGCVANFFLAFWVSETSESEEKPKEVADGEKTRKPEHTLFSGQHLLRPLFDPIWWPINWLLANFIQGDRNNRAKAMVYVCIQDVRDRVRLSKQRKQIDSHKHVKYVLLSFYPQTNQLRHNTICILREKTTSDLKVRPPSPPFPLSSCFWRWWWSSSWDEGTFLVQNGLEGVCWWRCGEEVVPKNFSIRSCVCTCELVISLISSSRNHRS